MRIRFVKSSYSHFLMLIGAILAFVPIIAVDYLLDAYVGYREKAIAQQHVETVSSHIDASISDGVSALRQVIAASPSGVARNPMMTWAGSPGMRRSRRKTSTETPNKVGPSSSSLLMAEFNPLLPRTNDLSGYASIQTFSIRTSRDGRVSTPWTLGRVQ